MDGFFSTYTNRVDQKGRVSIPAPFRLLLGREGLDELYCCPAMTESAVDAGGSALRASIGEHLAQYARFTPDHEFLSTALASEGEFLKIDSDGRVVLTDSIREQTGITDRATFVGHIFKFQIWEPGRYEAHRQAARARRRELLAGAAGSSPGRTG